MQASVLNNIATYEYKEGIVALHYCDSSLRLETDEKRKARVYNTIGMIYIKYGNDNYREATEHLRKLLK
jgi:hypothetical protein